jgi:hypothetical protein
MIDSPGEPRRTHPRCENSLAAGENEVAWRSLCDWCSRRFSWCAINLWSAREVCWVWLPAAARNGPGRREHFSGISGSWHVPSGITTARTSLGQDE